MKTELSKQELAVLTLAGQGLTDDQIATELGISSGTVNSYWVRIRGKLGHMSRTELVARNVQRLADERYQQATSDHKDAAESTSSIIQRNTRLQQRLLDQAHSEIEKLKRQISDLQAGIQDNRETAE